jgi:hypothetical protein
MLPCKKIVEVVSSSEKKSFMMSLEIKLHLLMCKHCKAYVEQLVVMKKQYKKLFKVFTKVDEGHLHDLEEQVIKNIKDKK